MKYWILLCGVAAIVGCAPVDEPVGYAVTSVKAQQMIARDLRLPVAQPGDEAYWILPHAELVRVLEQVAWKHEYHANYQAEVYDCEDIARQATRDVARALGLPHPPLMMPVVTRGGTHAQVALWTDAGLFWWDPGSPVVALHPGDSETAYRWLPSF